MNKTFLCLGIILIPLYIFAIDSVQLTDVIKSNGTGDINLFKDINATSLESYRQSNGGNLIFGVDVNEAANGTEKSTSQAITIKSAVLTIEKSSGNTLSFNAFKTKTKATVAEINSATRNTYYTLIGNTGSNRITASNSIQSSFDSTIEFDIGENLKDAIIANLTITLLETDTQRGDPEAFYDFSNGFEDLAILNNIDSTYLDTLEAGRSEAPAVELTDDTTDTDLFITNRIYYPSTTTSYTVAYEDLFPSKGDYDFNDLVVSYQISFGLNSNNRLVDIKGSAYLLGRGAAYDHDWKLKIEMPSNSSGIFSCNIIFPQEEKKNSIYVNKSLNGTLDEIIFSNTANLYPPFNTFDANQFNKGPCAEFQYQLNNAVSLNQIGDAPFDPYLFVHDTNYEIHLVNHAANPGSKNYETGDTEFKDIDGYPFAMLLPIDWEFPLEYLNLGNAYPEFIPYIQSQETQFLNWYEKPGNQKVKKYQVNTWYWSK